MSKKNIPYNVLVQNALRDVVREILKDISKTGPIGDHYFYLAFDTSHKGIEISAKLRKQFPNEMTIVLQHQFWNLEVHKDYFKVKLHFGNLPEILKIPFASLVGFYDPSVDFAIDFGRSGKTDSTKNGIEDTVEKSDEVENKTRKSKTKSSVPKPFVIATRKKTAETSQSDTDSSSESEDAKVISLDDFRNKKN